MAILWKFRKYIKNQTFRTLISRTLKFWTINFGQKENFFLNKNSIRNIVELKISEKISTCPKFKLSEIFNVHSKSRWNFKSPFKSFFQSLHISNIKKKSTSNKKNMASSATFITILVLCTLCATTVARPQPEPRAEPWFFGGAAWNGYVSASSLSIPLLSINDPFLPSFLYLWKLNRKQTSQS